jgi:hypothetical protein
VKSKESFHGNKNGLFGLNIPDMRWPTAAGVSAALAILAYGSVLVFLAFDRNSNSASDTIRPTIITMGPVWALAIWSGVSLLRRHR